MKGNVHGSAPVLCRRRVAVFCGCSRSDRLSFGRVGPSSVGVPRGGEVVTACTYGRHQGVCSRRAARASHALELCHQSLQVVQGLESQSVDADQLDLFQSAVSVELDFWWGVHAACGREFRRLDRVFWRACKHGRVLS